MRIRQLCLAVAVATGCVVACAGAEEHTDGIVARILENASKIKAADPQAVPMAFWEIGRAHV